MKPRLARTALALAASFAFFLSAPQALAQSIMVAITAPQDGDTVTGTTPVNASVSIIGLLFVRGVQFKLDGVNLGAEDTSEPYSISWNTRTASNGTHTLTAVARDSLGMLHTSSPVTVTVFNDLTPPAVSITSPAAGASVSGTVAITASASDNVGVAGVRFKVDGANLGAEDTSAPYAVTWDTTTAANGSHTLTAVARDAAGNSTTSTPVTVSVNNAPPPPAESQRFENTDAAVSFGSGWAQDTARPWSGGSAMLSTTPGAQASFAFTGTSVSWIGGRASSTGIARVFLDGALVAEVDTFSKNSEEVRVPMFTLHGLANAAHTLTIQVTGQQNPAAFGNFIVVDAFDVPAATISRRQETDPDVTYSGAWVPGDVLRPWSAGTAKLSSVPGARATFTFTGTAVTWVGARGTQTGIARVFLDGAQVAEVDTYSATEEVQAAVFSASGLADGEHVIAIEATGLKNPAAEAALVAVDGFDVISTDVRRQDTDAAIVYSAGWIQDNRDKAYSEGASAESVTSGAQATITFTGSGITWIGARGPQTGIARVYLDGQFVGEIDTYAPGEGVQYPLYRASGLAPGSHTLMIEVTGRRNLLSKDTWILLDAFDVTP